MNKIKQIIFCAKSVTFIVAGFVVFFLVPTFAEAATLYLSPSSGTYNVGSTITVSIRTNTQGVSVNTAEANISYSTETLELVRVSQGATFYLPAPGSPGQGPGTAYFGGGVPSPGYTGNNGAVGTLTFRAKAVGPATINISGGKVLLNDGFGTNALSGRSGANFTIGEPPPPPVGLPTVNSSTHPDQGSWYTARNLELSWTRPSGAHGFSFDLTRDANTIPDNTLDTTITTQKSYSDLADGTWYFHIKARGQTTGFGNTQHFKINIDNAPPKTFEVKIEGTESNFAALFETNDELSGIKRYDLYVDSELYKEDVKSPFSLAELGNGSYSIKIAAIDLAGNKMEAVATVKMEGIKSSARLEWLKTPIMVPLYIILLLNLLLMLIVLVLLYLLLKKNQERHRTSRDINELKEEIDSNLNSLKKEISRKISGLKADTREELAEKEAKLSEEVKEGIGEAINKIDTSITKVTKKRTKKK